MKLDPDELREVASELEKIRTGHLRLMEKEPTINKHIVEAEGEAMEKWKDLQE